MIFALLISEIDIARRDFNAFIPFRALTGGLFFSCSGHLWALPESRSFLKRVIIALLRFGQGGPTKVFRPD